jgi:hypothetical protein
VAAAGVHAREIEVRSFLLAAWLVKTLISITINEGLCQSQRDISVLLNRTVTAERACFQMRLSGYGACAPSALRLQRFCRPKQSPHAQSAALAHAQMPSSLWTAAVGNLLPVFLKSATPQERSHRAGNLIMSVSACPFCATQRAAEPHLTRTMHGRRWRSAPVPKSRQGCQRFSGRPAVKLLPIHNGCTALSRS